MSLKNKKRDFEQTEIYKKIKISESKGYYDLVIGEVQSGKTNVIISHCYKAIKEGKKAIIITRNLNVDKIQMQGRIKKFNEKYNLEGKEKLKPLIVDKNTNDISKHNILLAIGHPKQIDNVHNIVYDNEDIEFCLCIDEVDLLAGNTNKGETNINKLIKENNVVHTLGITATPMATLMGMKKDKLVNRVFKLDAPEDYVGIGSKRLVFHEVNPISAKNAKNFNNTLKANKPITNNVKSIKKNNKINTKKPTNLEIIDKILNSCKRKDFCISLILSEIKNDNQDLLIEEVVKRNKEWVGLVFNQNNVRIVYKGTNQSVITLSRNPIKETDSLGALPASLIELKKRGIKKIVIVAGKKADRGISFVDEDFESDTPYHLTDLYIRSDDKSIGHCEQLIQKMRILGRYKDKEPLNIWTNKKLWEEIQKCYKQIKLFTHELTQKRDSEDGIWDSLEKWNKIFEQITQKASEAPKKTTRKRIERGKWQKIINNLRNNNINDIEYDNATEGFYIKQPEETDQNKFVDRTINYPDDEGERDKKIKEDVSYIIDKLSRISPERFSNDKPIHKITEYIPNIIKNNSDIDKEIKKIQGEFYEPLKGLIEDLKKSDDKKLVKKLKDNKEYTDKLKILAKKAKDTIHKHINPIIRNNDFYTTNTLKELNQQVDKEDIFDNKSYIQNTNTYKMKLKGDINMKKDFDEGYYRKISRDKFKTPLSFRYGNFKTLVSGKVPALIDTNFLFNFKITNKDDNEYPIDTDIKDGDIVCWQNLFGRVFVNIKSDTTLNKKAINNQAKKVIKLKNSKKKEKKTRIIKKKKKAAPGYTAANPEIKKLFNEHIIPSIIRFLLKKNKEDLAFMLCDNEINTLKTLIDVLKPDELKRIIFKIIDFDEIQVKRQKDLLFNLYRDSKYKDKLDLLKTKPEIIRGDLSEKCRILSNKYKNKFVYADTCGSEIDSKYHESLIRDNINDTIIVGTYSQHDKDPKSYLGRTLLTHKTITYEYGRKTIMKTYISIINDTFKEWYDEYTSKFSRNNIFKVDRENIVESKLPHYKKIDNIVKTTKNKNLRKTKQKRKSY